MKIGGLFLWKALRPADVAGRRPSLWTMPLPAFTNVPTVIFTLITKGIGQHVGRGYVHFILLLG